MPADPFETQSPDQPVPHGVGNETNALPQHIGRFRIEKILGQGGFGVVYLAHDEQLQRRVAIKVPKPQFVQRAEDRELYLKEARTVAGLEHPNIVPVLEVGSTPEFPIYIVSKYILGNDLAGHLKSKSPKNHEAVQWMIDIADALREAHRKGFVHRDIKPQNILVDQDERVYLVDFGLALADKDVGKRLPAGGTPAYMSPEQARGEGHRVDGRSDLFSLGVLFYEMLCGRRPFQGSSQLELLEQITELDPKPLRQWVESVPQELERICFKMLAKRKSERYSSAKELVDDLKVFLTKTPLDSQSVESGSPPNAIPTSANILPVPNWFYHYLRPYRDGTTSAFVGREWLFREFGKWQDPDGPSAVKIVADYGSGKTAIIAELVLNAENPLHKHVLASHFCWHRDPNTKSAPWMLGNLAAQLATRLSEYGDKVCTDLGVQDALRRRHEPDRAYNALTIGILEPLCKIRPPDFGVCFLLIDAIDESLDHHGAEPISEIAQLLPDIGKRLPKWLRLVVTTGPDKCIEPSLAGFHQQAIDNNSADNHKDLRKYVEDRLKTKGFQDRLNESETTAEEAGKLLKSKSEGRFFYIVKALDAVLPGDLTFARLNELPAGVYAMYDEFFKRIFPTPDAYHRTLAVVQVLLAAQGKLNRDQLVACFGRDQTDQVDQSLNKLSQFLVDSGGYEFNHKSLYDWLSTPGLPFFVDASSGHSKLADWAIIESAPYRTKGTLGRCDRYCYQHGVLHLVQDERVADAVELLFWIDQIEKNSQSAGKGHTHKDVLMIVAAITEADAKRTPANKQGDNAVDAVKLWSLVQTSYATDDLERVLGWMGHTQEEWNILVPELLKTEDYVVRYAAACGQARRFQKLVETDKPLAEREIGTLFDGDINHQEMACYTIAELAKVYRERSTPWLKEWLNKLSSSNFYFARSALGDALIDWSLNGLDNAVNNLEINSDFWKPHWPYLALDIFFIAARRSRNDAAFDRWGLLGYDKQIRADRRFFKTAETWKYELLQEFGSETELGQLVENHFFSKDEDEANPGTWQKMQDLFRDDALSGVASFDRAFRLMRYLFSHPQWTGAERASSMLKHIAAQPQCRTTVFRVIDKLLLRKPKSNWRIVAGALDSTYLLRNIDVDGRFEEYLLERRHFAHVCCRVRSICAENFVADLLDSDPAEWKNQLKKFKMPVQCWLADEDCWVLEHMYRLFHKPIDPAKADSPKLSEWIPKMSGGGKKAEVSLLARIGPEWHTLDRERFLLQLEECRKQQLEQRRKGTSA